MRQSLGRSEHTDALKRRLKSAKRLTRPERLGPIFTKCRKREILPALEKTEKKHLNSVNGGDRRKPTIVCPALQLEFFRFSEEIARHEQEAIDLREHFVLPSKIFEYHAGYEIFRPRLSDPSSKNGLTSHQPRISPTSFVSHQIPAIAKIRELVEAVVMIRQQLDVKSRPSEPGLPSEKWSSVK